MGGARPLGFKTVELRFYGDLVDFVPGRRPIVDRTFDVAPSVKDIIEACGVPHPEVDLVLADGEPVGWDHAVRDGERIAVYPRFRTFDIADLSPVHVAPLDPLRFVLDGHLGRLARYLRLLGLDATLPEGADDPELAAIAAAEQRALLTRDIELLKRNAVLHGYFIRPIDPLLQCADVVRHFEIGTDQQAPFTRCTACNGVLQVAPPASVGADVPPSVRNRRTEFTRCPSCGRVYWEGSHVPRLTEIVAAVRRLGRAAR